MRCNCASPQQAGPEVSGGCGLRLHASILFGRDRLPARPGLESQEAGLCVAVGRGRAMASAEPSTPGMRASTPGPRPGGTPDCAPGATRLPFGRSGSGVPRLGERPRAVVEKRGPYMVTRAPSIQAKLRECGPIGAGAFCLGGLPGPLGGLRSPDGDTLEGQLQPAPVSRMCSERAGSWRLGDTAEWGKPR